MKTTFISAFVLVSFVTLNSCQKTIPGREAGALIITGSNAANASATYFTIARVFGDNMVIQRDKPASVWGTAPTGRTMSVKASWNNSPVSVAADKNNQWRVSLPAALANTTPQQLYITDGLDTIKFTNILIGDVWVCSGQSNMTMPVDSVSPPNDGYVGVTNYKQEIAAANWPLLRVAQVEPNSSGTPLYDLMNSAPWSACDPNNVKAYSATAYYFGRKLMTSLNVPVGLVVSAVGGSSCQRWINKEQIDADPVLKSYYGPDYSCSILYNAMMNPLKLLSVKGFIWYQGESNRWDQPVSNYTKLNKALIKGWRGKFNQGTLPFYFVQVAPYDVYQGGGDPRQNDYAFFREAQTEVRKAGATGMAVTMDVGDIKLIHPKEKKPVGERLALLALHKTYGLAVKDAGPRYASYTVNQDKATISFTSGSANGLRTINNAPVSQYFYAAGTDSLFRQGSAVISSNKMIVTAPAATPLPIIAVRYAFTNFPIPNLQNSAGLPMEPFRTDAWAH